MSPKRVSVNSDVDFDSVHSVAQDSYRSNDSSNDHTNAKATITVNSHSFKLPCSTSTLATDCLTDRLEDRSPRHRLQMSLTSLSVPADVQQAAANIAASGRVSWDSAGNGSGTSSRRASLMQMQGSHSGRRERVARSSTSPVPSAFEKSERSSCTNATGMLAAMSSVKRTISASSEDVKRRMRWGLTFHVGNREDDESSDEDIYEVLSQGSCTSRVAALQQAMNKVEKKSKKTSSHFGWISEIDSDKSRKACYEALNCNTYARTVGMLIFFNALLLGIELDQHDSAANGPSLLPSPLRGVPGWLFDVFEAFFLCVFGLDLAVRAYVFRRRLLKDWITFFDFLAMLPIFGLIFSAHSSKFRVLRMLKLARLVRFVRMFKELQVLMASIWAALRSLFWIGTMLMLLVYVCAIFCTIIIGQNSDFSADNDDIVEYETITGEEVNTRRYWGNIFRSMFSLFQLFTLDDWNKLVRPIVETHSPAMTIFFVIFLFLTTFGLLNLLMGAIVDQAMTVTKEAELERIREKEQDLNQLVLAAARLFSMMDEDGNGTLSLQEIREFISSRENFRTLQRELTQLKLKIDCRELIDVSQMIIEDWVDPASDADPNKEGITLDEFCGAATRLQGVAKSRDMLAVLVTTSNIATRLDACERNMLHLQQSNYRQEEKLDRVLKAIEKLSLRNLQASPPLSPVSSSRRHSTESDSSERGRELPPAPPALPVRASLRSLTADAYIKKEGFLKRKSEKSASVDNYMLPLSSDESPKSPAMGAAQSSFQSESQGTPRDRSPAAGGSDEDKRHMIPAISQAASLRAMRGSFCTEGSRGMRGVARSISQNSQWAPGAQAIEAMREYTAHVMHNEGSEPLG